MFPSAVTSDIWAEAGLPQNVEATKVLWGSAKWSKEPSMEGDFGGARGWLVSSFFLER